MFGVFFVPFESRTLTPSVCHRVKCKKTADVSAAKAAVVSVLILFQEVWREPALCHITSTRVTDTRNVKSILCLGLPVCST